MPANLVCPRCRGTMVKGTTKGTFTGWRSDGMTGTTQTVKYMCDGCGYVEERAINAQYLNKTQ